MSDPFSPLDLKGCQAQKVYNGAYSLKIDYAAQVEGIQNLKGYQNHIIGTKVTAILMNVGILPMGAVASERICVQPAKQGCFILDQINISRIELRYID